LRGEALRPLGLAAGCRERFGATRDCREGGFILSDGSMLDFSGKTAYESDDPSDWGRVVRPENAGRHNVDHREISFCLGSKAAGYDPIFFFQNRANAVRFFADGDLDVHFDVGESPTVRQWDTIERCADGRKIFYDVYHDQTRLDAGVVDSVRDLMLAFGLAKGRAFR